MFDLVHHTDSNRLYIVVINMRGPLLSVRVLTQLAGHPLSETVGCCGVIGQPKVLTDGTFIHQLNSFTVRPHHLRTLDTILTTVRRS